MNKETKKRIAAINSGIVPEGYKKTKVGIVPIEWEVTNCKNVCKNIIAGATPSTKIDDYWKGTICWMSSSEIHKKVILDTEAKITKLGYESCSTKMIPEKCVLIALAGQGKTRGCVAYNLISICTNQSLAALIPNTINYLFLYHYLDLQYKNLRAVSSGDSSRGGLNLEIISNFKVVFPPLHEQQKIAEILSTQDKLIELKRKLIDLKKKQKKWLMQELLTGKKRLKGFSGKWKKVRLGEIATDFSYGMNSASKKYDGENKYIRITDIDETTHKYSYDDIVSPDGKLDDKYLVNKNDILFARTGASVGKSYLYNENDGKLYFAGFLIRVNIQKENAYYIFANTLTDKYKKWVQIMSVRSGQPGINANEYATLKIYLPPLEEQTAIAEILSQQDKEIELLEKEVDLEKQKKKALMRLLLTGKVRIK